MSYKTIFKDGEEIVRSWHLRDEDERESRIIFWHVEFMKSFRYFRYVDMAFKGEIKTEDSTFWNLQGIDGIYSHSTGQGYPKPEWMCRKEVTKGLWPFKAEVGEMQKKHQFKRTNALQCS